jgi:hypothetical protein
MITDICDIGLYKNELLLSNKKYSLHHVIEKLLSISGPANVDVISYSVSDAALSFLCSLKNKGSINELRLLFDRSVKKHKFALCVFAARFADQVMFADTHVKLVTIQNHSHNMAIITSANLNENKRSELFHIISDIVLFSHCQVVFQTLSKNAERFTYNG